MYLALRYWGLKKWTLIWTPTLWTQAWKQIYPTRADRTRALEATEFAFLVLRIFYMLQCCIACAEPPSLSCWACMCCTAVCPELNCHPCFAEHYVLHWCISWAPLPPTNRFESSSNRHALDATQFLFWLIIYVLHCCFS